MAEEKGAGGKAPENFWNDASSIVGNALFDIEKALQTGQICSFAENCRSLDRKDSLDARQNCMYAFLFTFTFSYI